MVILYNQIKFHAGYSARCAVEGIWNFPRLHMPLQVKIPDTNYWKEQIKCQYACPVRTDARGYVRACADGDFEKAYLIARAPNPLASTCGRVCGAPCEAACRRGSVDKSISIRALKRTAVENAESVQGTLELIQKIQGSLRERVCADVDDMGTMLDGIADGKVRKAEGKSVGIIGSGPAGLSAAHDLALLGFSPVIYEAESLPAGMLFFGVPAYRLPRELLWAEIDVIKSLGVEIVTNCTVGRDVSLAELRRRHDAVVIAVGFKKSRTIPVPGHDAHGVFGGVDFLRAVAFDQPRHIGKNVVVLGGGNVAYDVARSALRQQQVDIAEAAFHDREGVKVTLCCIEKLEEMLADEIEILEGEEEGIRRLNGYGPQKILTDECNRVKGVLFHKVISIFDENNRFNPRYDANDTVTLEADTVLFAIGQRSDITFIDSERDGIAIDDRGMIKCNPSTLMTTAENVFVAGDLAHGAKLLIDAVASGKKAARAIYEKFTGRSLKTTTIGFHAPIANYGREFGYEKIPRQKGGAEDVRARISSFQEIVEKGFTPDQARREGSRCFDCGVNTIFDGNRCILCGGCADVCPELCLKLVPVSALDGGKDFDELVGLTMRGNNTDEMSAIIMDNERCIRCALCAVRCPTDAITMERFSFKECLP